MILVKMTATPKEVIQQVNDKLEEVQKIVTSINEDMVKVKVEVKDVNKDDDYSSQTHVSYWDYGKTKKHTEYKVLDKNTVNRTWWYMSGQLHKTGNYNKGEQHGIWIHYNKDGSIMKAIKYNNGKVISQIPT